MLYQSEKIQEELVRLRSEAEQQEFETGQKVQKLVEVKRKIEELNDQKSELEGYFLKLAGKDLEDTKFKSVSYKGTDGAQVIATMAESVKLVYPTFLKQVFGDAYKDAVTEETKYKLSAPASRMLAGLWQKEYIRMTVAEAVRQIATDADRQTALLKKVKGANYAGDKKNLMSIGGFDEKTAEEYAYFIAEAAVWESFLRLLKVQGLTEEAETQYLNWIDGAVVVEETPKITVLTGDD